MTVSTRWVSRAGPRSRPSCWPWTGATASSSRAASGLIRMLRFHRLRGRVFNDPSVERFGGLGAVVYGEHGEVQPTVGPGAQAHEATLGLGVLGGSAGAHGAHVAVDPGPAHQHELRRATGLPYLEVGV